MGLRERREGWFCLEKKKKYFRGNGIYIFIETHIERQRERKGEWEREK